jgi:hypothetical protein
MTQLMAALARMLGTVAPKMAKFPASMARAHGAAAPAALLRSPLPRPPMPRPPPRDDESGASVDGVESDARVDGGLEEDEGTAASPN